MYYGVPARKYLVKKSLVANVSFDKLNVCIAQEFPLTQGLIVEHGDIVRS